MQIWAQKEHVISPFEALNVSIHRFRLETWQGLFWLWFFRPPCHPVSILPVLHVLFPRIWFIDIHDFHSTLCSLFLFYIHYYFFSHGIGFESDLSLTASALLLLRVFFSPVYVELGFVCETFLFFSTI